MPARWYHRHRRCVLIIVNLCLFCCAEKEIGKIEPRNPNCIIGEPMNITFILNLSQKEKQYDLHDVYFTIDDKPVDSSFTHINRNHLILRKQTTLEMNYTYVRCFTKKRDTHIDSVHILVGYRPKPIELDSIISFNWTTLTIRWKQNISLYVTETNAWWKYVNDTDFKLCANQASGKCTVQLSESAGWQSNIIVKVNSSNVVGETEIGPLEFTIYDIVKPDAVRNLSVLSKYSESVTLKWNLPKFYEKLIINVSYIDQWNKMVQIRSLDIEESPQSRTQFTLTDLEAYTRYNVTVQCKSALGGFWSNPVIIHVQTLPSMPFGVPHVTSGCYHMSRTSKTTRKVTFYWQRVSQRDLQGPIKNYRLRYTGNTHLNTEIIPPNILNYTFENLNQDSEYSVFVDVSNSIGYNHTAQTRVITIPPITSGNGGELEVRVTAYSNYLVNIKREKEIDDALFFTVFWCEQSNSHICEKELQWRELPMTVYSHNITLPKRYTGYQFGIAVERLNGNQGIRWVDCVYDRRYHPEPPDITDVTEISTTSFKIWLRQPICRYKAHGILYNVNWCPSPEDRNKPCPDSSQSRNVSASDTRFFELTNLEPDSEYRVEVTSISDGGLESLYYVSETKRTLKTMGGLAPGLICLFTGLAVVLFCTLVIGLIAIYKFGCDVKKWFTSFSVDLTDQLPQQDEPVDVEKVTNWEYTTVDDRPFFEPVNSNTYVAASEVSVKTESSALFPGDAYGGERINPEGASNVEDYGVGYKRCHYSLPDKVKRKIKKTRKRPNQIYMEPRPKKPNPIYTEHRPSEKRTASLKRKETGSKLAEFTERSENVKRCESSEDEVTPSNEEKNNLLLSQTSSDYPGAWSDNYTNTQASTESLNEILDVSDFRNEKLHLPDGKNSDDKPAEKSQMTSAVDRLTAMNQNLSDWDSSDEDDSGYRRRATKIESRYVDEVESDDSDENNDSGGYRKRANEIKQYYVDDGEGSDEDSDKDSTAGNEQNIKTLVN